MTTRQSGIVLGQIRTLFNEGRIGTMTDEQLLEQFAARRAQAVEASEAAECAFEAIVLRHGPMVLAVCRRVLHDPHEVEDAFQATFLILARRAGSIRKRSVLGGWLRKVAHRVAARAKALSARRTPLDADHPVSTADEPASIAEREDLRIMIERVVPGEARIHWQPNSTGARKTPDRYYLAPLRAVGPGQTVHVDLIQEGGRPLVGRVAAGDLADGQLDLAGGSVYFLLRTPEVPYPRGLSEPDRREWLRRWRFTDEGREYRQIRRGFAHAVELKPDGSFRVDEVQSGAYQLHVNVRGFGKLIRDFDIPEPPAGQGGGPVDLGTLVLKRS